MKTPQSQSGSRDFTHLSNSSHLLSRRSWFSHRCSFSGRRAIGVLGEPITLGTLSEGPIVGTAMNDTECSITDTELTSLSTRPKTLANKQTRLLILILSALQSVRGVVVDDWVSKLPASGTPSHVPLTTAAHSRRQHANEDVEKMILGNKCDVEDKRMITKERGESVSRLLVCVRVWRSAGQRWLWPT